jgi:hypothetical protein
LLSLADKLTQRIGKVEQWLRAHASNDPRFIMDRAEIDYAEFLRRGKKEAE